MIKKSLDIDNIDKKILLELEKDARATISSIGKRLKISKDSVKYRINNLEKRGIILGYHPLLNMSSLGYDALSTLLLKASVLPSKKENEMINYLKEKQEICLINRTEGIGNFQISHWAKSINDLIKIKKEIYGKYGEYFNEASLALHFNRHYYTTLGFLDEPEKYIHKRNEAIAKKVDVVEIDKKDSRILYELNINSRAHLSQIGKKTGMSTEVVHYRMKNLIKKGVMLGFRPKINYPVLGLEYYHIMLSLKDLREESYLKIKEYTKNSPYIVYYDELVGHHDITLEMITPSYEILVSILCDMKEKFIQELKRIDVLKIYDSVKSIYIPPL